MESKTDIAILFFSVDIYLGWLVWPQVIDSTKPVITGHTSLHSAIFIWADMSKTEQHLDEWCHKPRDHLNIDPSPTFQI